MSFVLQNPPVGGHVRCKIIAPGGTPPERSVQGVRASGRDTRATVNVMWLTDPRKKTCLPNTTLSY
eukprot:1450369-Pyramimonas_sp.AAC.1